MQILDGRNDIYRNVNDAMIFIVVVKENWPEYIKEFIYRKRYLMNRLRIENETGYIRILKKNWNTIKSSKFKNFLLP